MRRLVDRATWERGFLGARVETSAARQPKRSWRSSYHEHLLLDVLYPRILGDLRGKRLLEIGSAPGRHLARLAERFGVDPYGAELTDAGVALNREVFEQHGLDPAKVVQADLFDDDFRTAWREAFDVVLSRGLLEHFSAPAEVVKLHLDLLAPDGWLIVVIPNLRGVYGVWQRRFDPDLLSRHNLETMRAEVFRGAFDTPELTRHHCGHYGTFDTWALSAGEKRGVAVHNVVHWLRRVQVPLNVALRLVFGDRGCETATFSPFLVYVGRKRS